MMPVIVMSKIRTPSAIVADTRAGISRVLDGHADKVLSTIQGEWTGWVKPTGGSFAGWKRSAVQPTKNRLSVSIGNAVHYVPFVHRTGTKVREVEKIVEAILPPLTPKLIQSLGAVAASVPLTERG